MHVRWVVAPVLLLTAAAASSYEIPVGQQEYLIGISVNQCMPKLVNKKNVDRLRFTDRGLRKKIVWMLQSMDGKKYRFARGAPNNEESGIRIDGGGTDFEEVPYDERTPNRYAWTLLPNPTLRQYRNYYGNVYVETSPNHWAPCNRPLDPIIANDN